MTGNGIKVSIGMDKDYSLFQNRGSNDNVCVRDTQPHSLQIKGKY